ncbi:hypothetical protein B484DRAFT_409986, partial [Ochromonadaceae sp. CCMP2298]
MWKGVSRPAGEKDTPSLGIGREIRESGGRAEATVEVEAANEALTMHAQLVLILLLLSLLSLCCSFSLHSLRPTRTSFASSASVSKASASASASARLSMSSKDEREQVTVEIDLGPDYKPVTCDFRPIFFNSTFFTVNYPVPFGLNIEKPPRGFPCPIVNKDSKREGGEMT